MNISSNSIFVISLPDRIQVNCPIEVKKYSLAYSKEPQDIYSEISFINVSKTVIKAFRIHIECFDSLEESVDSHLLPLRVTFQDISILGRSEYVTPDWIRLTDRQRTRRIRIKIEKILYQDGSIWQDDLSDFQIVPFSSLPDSILTANLVEIAGDDAIVFASDNADNAEFWTCVCGKANEIGYELCKRCGREKNKVLSFLTQDQVLQLIKNRQVEYELILQKRKESERTAENEKVQKERAYQEQIFLQAEQKKKKRMKIFRKITYMSILVITIILLTYFMGIPLGKYIYANRLVNNQEYSKAIDIYQTIPDFFDAKDKYISAYLKYAYSEFEDQEYKTAQKLFSQAESNTLFQSYKDELIYMQGLCAENKGLYYDALNIFNRCSKKYYCDYDGKNCIQKTDEIRIILAKEHEDNGKLIDAYKLYCQVSTNQEIIEKVTTMKAQMTHEAAALQLSITSAINNNQIEIARDYLSQLEQIQRIYYSMFSQYLLSEEKIQEIKSDLVIPEGKTQINLLFAEYDHALNKTDYVNAIQFLQEADRINQDCSAATGGIFAVDAQAISDRFDIVADKLLALSPDDTLDTEYVGHAYIMTGESSDGGVKTKNISQGSAFGLKYYDIYIYEPTQVKWYRRSLNYLEIEPVEELVVEHEPCDWAEGGWYCYFYEDEPIFTSGYYIAELVYDDYSSNDVVIGRFYFHIE